MYMYVPYLFKFYIFDYIYKEVGYFDMDIAKKVKTGHGV